jgi:rfaE bifunctional protein nucleotidyltransferase chain/domain
VFVPDFEQKIITLEQLIDYKSIIKQPLVFTNGCFDILHRGHVTYLAEAKSMGKTLVVAVNSDESVKKLNKGDDRPINKLADRMAIIASLQSVDFVISFEQDTPLCLIMNINPDILVKGGDWDINKIIGADFVINNGGKVCSIPFLHDLSTTKTILKVLKT